MKKIFTYSLIIYLQLIVNTFSNEIKILYKINDSVITNQDVVEEINYLVSLNQNLGQLDNEQLSSNAQKSLIREKIKKDEINKFYDVNYEKAIESEKLSNIIKNFRENIGFKSNQEFEDYLKNKDLDIKELRNKFLVEQLWNQLIVDKYINLIKIDSTKIDNELEQIIKNNSKILSFNLSEIIFLEKDKDTIENKYQEIISSIQTIGFKDAAVIHSMSESSKLGGEIGWINQNQISNKIFLAIKNLEIGQFSNPIITAGGIILLKVNDKKKINANIDKEKEMERLIAFEKQRLLNEYSIIYYKEIENKSYVEKF
jgi:peptidyl-prolyl cis-trans isomerase SurA